MSTSPNTTDTDTGNKVVSSDGAVGESATAGKMASSAVIPISRKMAKSPWDMAKGPFSWGMERQEEMSGESATAGKMPKKSREMRRKEFMSRKRTVWRPRSASLGASEVWSRASIPKEDQAGQGKTTSRQTSPKVTSGSSSSKEDCETFVRQQSRTSSVSGLTTTNEHNQVSHAVKNNQSQELEIQPATNRAETLKIPAPDATNGAKEVQEIPAPDATNGAKNDGKKWSPNKVARVEAVIKARRIHERQIQALELDLLREKNRAKQLENRAKELDIQLHNAKNRGIELDIQLHNAKNPTH